MAASGIAEHNEARRREVGYLRKAHEILNKERHRAQKISQNEYELITGRRQDTQKPTSYDHQVQRMQTQGMAGQNHDAASVDRQRRLAHLEQSRAEYSAKLPNRYSSIDYVSQW